MSGFSNMLTENDLKIGETYRYWSPSKMQHDDVIYLGRRTKSVLGDAYIFRFRFNLNEVWTNNLINICVST